MHQHAAFGMLMPMPCRKLCRAEDCCRFGTRAGAGNRGRAQAALGIALCLLQILEELQEFVVSPEATDVSVDRIHLCQGRLLECKACIEVDLCGLDRLVT
jgi:hypothetical protein